MKKKTPPQENTEKEKKKVMENLAEMLKSPTTEETPVVTSEAELSVNVPPPELPQQPQSSVQINQQSELVVPLINLYTWFFKNSSRLQNVIITCPVLNEVQRTQYNYDPRKNLVLFVKRDGLTDAKQNLDLVLWKKPESYTMVDLDPLTMNVFEEGMEASFNVNTRIVMYAHTVKTGLYLFSCVNSNGLHIPYDMQKIKKNSSEFTVPGIPTTVDVDVKLAQPCSLDTLKILYPPFKKEENIVTNLDAVKFLQSKREKTVDNNHLMLIHKTISSIVFGG